MIVDHARPVAILHEPVAEPEHGFGWLAAVIPAGSERFRVSDPRLAALLRSAGATLVDVAPDVEIGPAAALYGDADLSIALLGHPVRGPRPWLLRRARAQPPLPLRALRRVALSLRLRVDVAAAQRRVRSLGHTEVHVMYWDHQMAPTRTDGRRDVYRRAVGALPQRALVLGHSGPAKQPIAAVARAQAGRAARLTLRDGPVAVRTDTLIVDAGAAILRVGIGPGRTQILAQRDALAQLRLGVDCPVVEERIPWEHAGGACGLAEWTLERKLPGTAPAGPVSGTLLSDCLDFLVALHRVRGPDPAGPATLIDQAEIVASACAGDHAARISAIARWVQSELADVPRGYAHGDFFHGNLLVEGGRLRGVVDWEASGPGRLPMLDLLHLRLTSMRDVSDIDWGPLLARHLLGDQVIPRDAAVRSYAERIGLDAGPQRMQALALAYWLDYAAAQLRAHPHRRRQPGWVPRNIELVLAAIPRRIGVDI